jgi:hypothetical protein
MTTNLAAKMRRNARRLDKLNIRVASVLAAMRRGYGIQVVWALLVPEPRPLRA